MSASFQLAVVRGTESSLVASLRAFLPRLHQALPELFPSVQIEEPRLGPFAPDQLEAFDLVLNRVGHWNGFAREWAKSQALAGAYVLPNPFAFETLTKASTQALAARLGIQVPRTFVLPPKDQTHWRPEALARVHALFSLDQLGEDLGYPLFLKPHDGGGWVGVERPFDPEELARAYDQSGSRVLLAQEDRSGGFMVRALAFGPTVLLTHYDPSRPHTLRYQLEPPPLAPESMRALASQIRVLLAALGLEINSVEFCLRDGRADLIDAYNAVPDLSLLSLRAAFPGALLGLCQWIGFVAATGRRMRLSPPLGDFLEAQGEVPKLKARAQEALEVQAFESFWRGHQEALEAVTDEFLASEDLRQVAALEFDPLPQGPEIQDPLRDFLDEVRRHWKPLARLGLGPLSEGSPLG